MAVHEWYMAKLAENLLLVAKKAVDIVRTNLLDNGRIDLGFPILAS